MATRTTPTPESRAAQEALDILAGDWEDKAGQAEAFTVETTRGPFTVWSGPVSLQDLDEITRLTRSQEDGNVPIQNMADVLILLARTEDGGRMFRPPHRGKLLTAVDPVYIVKAAEFLVDRATAALDTAEEEAGKE